MSATALAGPRPPTTRTGRLGPLRTPAFARFWTAGLISDTGDWLLLVALPVYVFELTGSALVTSTVFVLGLAPGLVVGPLAGVLVDRWDRRRTMVTVSLAQAAALLPLLSVHGRGELWIVYAVTAIEAGLAQLFDPAKQALVPTLVPLEQLVSANSLVALTLNVGRLVGGPLGGVALQLGGLGGIVAADAASFLLAAILLAPGLARRTPVSADPSPSGSVWSDWLGGLSVIGRDPDLRSALVIAAVAAVAQGIFVVLFVVFVIQTLHGDSAEVGLLRGIQAIGGIAGGLLLGFAGRRAGPRQLVGGGLLAFGVIDLAIWNGPYLSTAQGVYVGLFIAVGIPGIGFLTGVTTLLQARTPGPLQGRIFSTYFSLYNGLQALGMLLAGLLAGVVGLAAILDAQAGLYLAAGVFGLVALRGQRRAVNG